MGEAEPSAEECRAILEAEGVDVDGFLRRLDTRLADVFGVDVVTGVECVGSCPVETCDEGPLWRCRTCGVLVCESHGGHPPSPTGRRRRASRCGPCGAVYRARALELSGEEVSDG